MSLSRILSLIILTLWCNTILAQDRPIGQWRSHLPYNSAVSIATDGLTLYVASQHAFYTLSIAGGELTKYSKVNGMSDVGMSKIAYDKVTGTVILTYENSNIDIFKDGSFYNIPDLKLKTVTGSKQVNHIYTEDGLAYLSTDVGVVVVNLAKKEIKETYTFTKNSEIIGIKGFAAGVNFYYTATDKGLYRAAKNSPNLQAFQQWTPMDTNRSLTGIAIQGDDLFVTVVDTVFVFDTDSLRSVYEDPDSTIINVVEGINCVWIMKFSDKTFAGKALRMNRDYLLTDSLNTLGEAYDLIDYPDPDSSKWIASTTGGLKRRTQKGETFDTVPPDGPGGVSNFDIKANNKELIIAHGGYDDKFVPLNNGDGFSVYKDDEWENYRIFKYEPFGDSTRDITNVVKGPNGEIYAGSTQSGLFVLNADETYTYYKQNSFISTSSTGEFLYRVSGLAFDNNGVLWMTVYGGVPNQLYARTTDGQWYAYNVSTIASPTNVALNIIVDNANQKWFGVPGGGVLVYDDNNTPELQTDDRYRQLQAGEGSGGLPDNNVYCMVSDKDGAIWIGTGNGIGIVNCPSQVIERQCEAEKRIVQFDQFAGFLFQNEQVRAIAVDGANRKWIGTNNGLWLISESGDEIIDRYTVDNSPLPSNIIQKIAVDAVTGDVYIGTERGLMSLRGQATDGGRKNEDDLIVFPNPVPTGYSGTIAIKGFVENADVRITDVSGQLVYRTTALGGQAVWNGLDYTGRRPQSGVYLIFGTNKDGSETVKGKMVFME